jgi:hypothetical protein
MRKMRKAVFKFFVVSIVATCFIYNRVQAQAAQPAVKKAGLFDGMIIAGYVDDGAYVNFTGPHIKWVKKPYALLLGVLPSLRFKEDKVAAGAKKNALVTPALGAGITFAYKHLAVQVPFYYNGKTSAADGKWKVGVGIGYRF